MKRLVLFFTFVISTMTHAQFSADFKSYLKENKTSFLNDKPGFGGKEKSNEVINKTPVILIHGNSDKAYSDRFPGPDNKWGWNNLISELLKNGHKKSEIYAFTWGNMNPALAQYNYHSYVNLKQIRDFIKLVKRYTGADKVNVVAHSMGVTLSRGAIQGGQFKDNALEHKKYSLGGRLKFIDKFVGIAGANFGIEKCYSSSFYPTCAKTNGFFPHSKYLRNINGREEKLAQKVYSICSISDDVIGNNLKVMGENTCFIPKQDGKLLFTKLKLNHFETKTKTSKDILYFLNQ